MSQVLCFSLVLGLAGQPPPKREDSSGHTERLEIMTKSMVHTQVRADDAREEVLDSWQYCDAGVSAQDISRMEAAHDWLRVIFVQYPQERLCLSQWAAAIAYRRSLRRLLAQRGWSRSTFYRYVTAGALIIAIELGRQGEPVV